MKYNKTIYFLYISLYNLPKLGKLRLNKKILVRKFQKMKFYWLKNLYNILLKRVAVI